MKKLNIHPNQTIESIRICFAKYYPFLRIECFKPKPKNETGSSKKLMYPSDTMLSECMNMADPVSVNFKDTDTVKQFEEKIHAATGMNIQVFRKSGQIWLETTVTDSWTLQQQNEEGRLSTIDVKEEIENADDHDIF